VRAWIIERYGAEASSAIGTEDERWVLGPDDIDRRELVERPMWAIALREARGLPTYQPAVDELRRHPVIGPCMDKQVATDRALTLLTPDPVIGGGVGALLAATGAPDNDLSPVLAKLPACVTDFATRRGELRTERQDAWRERRVGGQGQCRGRLVEDPECPVWLRLPPRQRPGVRGGRC
jgi:hypothetical protein